MLGNSDNDLESSEKRKLLLYEIGGFILPVPIPFYCIGWCIFFFIIVMVVESVLTITIPISVGYKYIMFPMIATWIMCKIKEMSIEKESSVYMQRRKKVKGECGAEFVESDCVADGQVHLTCSVNANYWLRTTYTNKNVLQKQCQEVCESCKNNPW